MRLFAKRAFFLGVLGLGMGALLLWQPARAISFRDDVPADEYLALAQQFPMVGAFAGEGEFEGCTATLVAPDKALTAAHCVDDNSDGQLDEDYVGTWSFLLGDDVDQPTHRVGIAGVVISPDWVQDGLGGHDLAVLELEEPIDDVELMVLSAQNPVGEVGTLVGYGDFGTGFGSSGAVDGRRRAAQNVIDVLLPFGDTEDEIGTLEADFDHPSGTTNTLDDEFGVPSDAEPLPLEGTSAPGDSGGPLLVDFGNGYVQVGVVHAGFNPLSLTEDDELAAAYGDISDWAPLLHPENIEFLNDNGIEVLPAE